MNLQRIMWITVMSLLALVDDVAIAALPERLPISCMSRIDGPDGKSVYVSCDRRFIFRGEMIDLWTGAAPSFEGGKKFDLSRNDFRPDEFSFAFLTPAAVKDTAYVYVSLDSDASRQYLKRLQMSPPRETMIRLVLVASVSRASQERNEIVWCAKDRISSVMSDASLLDKHVRPGPDCDKSGLMLAQASTYLFGIARLPFTVMANGKSFFGIPEDMPSTFEEMSK